MSHEQMEGETRSSPPLVNRQGKISLRGPYGSYRDNRLLSGILILLLLAEASLAILSLAPDHPAPPLTAGDLVRLSPVLLHLAVAILSAIWLCRSCKNGWLLDAPKMRSTPSAAAASIFLPIANLWKPLLILREIREASYGQNNTLKKALPVWCLLWVVSWALAVTLLSLTMAGSDQSTGESITKLNTVLGTVHLILITASILILAKITSAQHRKALDLSAFLTQG